MHEKYIVYVLQLGMSQSETIFRGFTYTQSLISEQAAEAGKSPSEQEWALSDTRPILLRPAG